MNLDYRKTRKKLLAELRNAGVKAPAKMYPLNDTTFSEMFSQEEQISQMREHLVQINLDREHKQE